MTDNNTQNISTILKNIDEAKRIAVVLPRVVNIDLLATASALEAAILSQKKTVMVFCVGKDLPELPFLKNTPQVHSALNSTSQLAIKVSNKNAQPAELRYDKDDSGLTVFITPKEGQFKEGDVTVIPSATNFDLVIILGAQNFEQLGSIYTENTKLFFETPHINIDIDPANEFYGTINFVQTTASSVAEVVMDIMEAMPNGLNNDSVSTGLLAGIISQTSSFRDPKTTPQAMLKASRLISVGARQQEIIQHLFKTKPLPLLQLWGRALARLTSLPEKQILTAILTKSDLEKTNLGVESLPSVARDITEMITGYSLVVLLAELPVTTDSETSTVQVLVAGLPFEDLSKVAADFSLPAEQVSTLKPQLLSGNYDYTSFHLDNNLVEVQEKLNKIIENRKSVV